MNNELNYAESLAVAVSLSLQGASLFRGDGTVSQGLTDIINFLTQTTIKQRQVLH